MKSIKVSLIMPVYNSEKYLKNTLDSIVNQTFEEFELIAIDDGSNDNSLNILNEYKKKDSRIRVIKQENSGVSKTRNKGILLAEGEYIGFIDADDLLEKDFLKVLYTLAYDNNADISMTGYSIFYKNSDLNVNKYTNLELDFKDISTRFESMLECGLGVNIWTKLYRKSMIENYKINFMENLNYDEDMFFSWKCALMSKRICFDNNTRYFYRLSLDSATMKYHEKMYNKYCCAFNDIREFAKRNNIYDSRLEREILVNFARKINVILTMIIRSSISLTQKYRNVNELLKKQVINDSINELIKFNTTKGSMQYLLKNIKNKKIILIIIDIYLKDFKIKLARKIKKYICK